MPRISIGGTREITVVTDISGQAVWVGSGEITVLSGDVRASQLGAWGVQVSGAVQVSGEVSLPSTQPVKISGETVKAEQHGTWGVQVSGAVIVSGDVSTSVSGDIVKAEQQGPWGVQVSGAVIVSGDLTASVSGQPVDIIVPTDIITNAVTTVGSISGGTILTSADCISVTVKALSTNSGDIYIGGYTAGNMPYSGYGLLLEPGEAINIDIDNIGKIHAFAEVSGDKVTYIANK